MAIPPILLAQAAAGAGQLFGGLLSGIGARKRARAADKAFRKYMATQLGEAARIRGEASLQREAIDDPRFTAGQREQVERARARSSEAINSQKTLGAAERAILQGQADVGTGDQLNQLEAQQRQRLLQGLQVEQAGRQTAGQITSQVVSDLASRKQRQADLAKQFQTSLTSAGLQTLTNFSQNALQADQNQQYLDILKAGQNDGVADYASPTAPTAPKLPPPSARFAGRLNRKIRRYRDEPDAPVFQPSSPPEISPQPAGFPVLSETSGIMGLQNLELSESTLPFLGGSFPGAYAEGGAVDGDGMGDKVPAVLEPGEVVFSNADLKYIEEAPNDEERGARFMEVYKKYEREADMQVRREEMTGEGGDTLTEIVQLATQLGMPPDQDQVEELEALAPEELEALAAGLRAKVAEANGATPQAMQEGGMIGGGEGGGGGGGGGEGEAQKRQQAEADILTRSIKTEDGRTLVVGDILRKDPKLRDSDENVFLITIDQELRGARPGSGPRGILSGIGDALGFSSPPAPTYGITIASLQEDINRRRESIRLRAMEELKEKIYSTRLYLRGMEEYGPRAIASSGYKKAQDELAKLTNILNTPELRQKYIQESARQRVYDDVDFWSRFSEFDDAPPPGPKMAASDATRVAGLPIGAHARYAAQAWELFKAAKPGTKRYEALEILTESVSRPGMSALEYRALQEKRRNLLQRASEVGLEDTLKEYEQGKSPDGIPALLRGLVD